MAKDDGRFASGDIGVVDHPLIRDRHTVVKIVVAIWNDVTDRKGWRQERDQFAPDIQVEIVETRREMVRAILMKDTPHDG